VHIQVATIGYLCRQLGVVYRRGNSSRAKWVIYAQMYQPAASNPRIVTPAAVAKLGHASYPRRRLARGALVRLSVYLFDGEVQDWRQALRDLRSTR